MLPFAYGSAEVTRILRGISGEGKSRSLANAAARHESDAKIVCLLRGHAVPITEAQVQELLKTVVDPTTGKDYVSSKEIKKVQVSGDAVTVDVVLGYPAKSQLEPVKQQIESVLGNLSAAVTVNVSFKIVSHAVQGGVKLVPGVRNIIAVASGKGGVGKSTVAVNLALALAAEGATVGVLDADIYGPSQPMMLGLQGQKPTSPDGKTLAPMVAHGLQAMSIGFLIDMEQPMVWRGPMVTQALEQLLRDTHWQDLDYLIVDMPPGTGDIQLTLAQKVPVTGAVIVTTPQDIALLDARKGLKMFEKVNVPILGVVENMSTHVCTNCGQEEHVFGTGGGDRLARENGVTVLGSLPLDIDIREQADSGNPTVVSAPESRAANTYREIARKVAVRIAEKAQNFSGAFPKIVIQNT
jgi:ATP-binding protein involved in chromosome partitioning